MKEKDILPDFQFVCIRKNNEKNKLFALGVTADDIHLIMR